MWITCFLPKHVAHTLVLPRCESTQRSCGMKETRSQVKCFVFVLVVIKGLSRYTVLGALQNNVPFVHFSVWIQNVRKLPFVWCSEQPSGPSAGFPGDSAAGDRVALGMASVSLASVPSAS